MCWTDRRRRFRLAAALAAALALSACAREAGAPLIEGRADAAAPAWNLAVQARAARTALPPLRSGERERAVYEAWEAGLPRPTAVAP